VRNRVRLIGHPEYLSVLELDIQTKNFQALGRIPELSSAGFLQLAQHIEFVQNFCILICSKKEKTWNGQANVQLSFRRGKITILKDSILCSSSSIFPCTQSQKAINDQKL